MRNLFYFPSKNIAVVVPFVILFSLVMGYFFNTESVKFLMPVAILTMVLPTMIGWYDYFMDYVFNPSWQLHSSSIAKKVFC